MWGLPDEIASDGGPQFGAEFGKWCQNRGILTRLSSAYNPASNGLAEASVKSTKHLLMKCLESGQNYRQALSEWRALPRADGFSPAEMFLGRRPRGILPALHNRNRHVDLREAAASRQRTTDIVREQHDEHAHSLSPLKVGEAVLVQNPKSKRWHRGGKIYSIRDNGQSYKVIFRNRAYLRGRKLLRPDPDPDPATGLLYPAPVVSALPPIEKSDAAPDTAHSLLRRSSRTRRPVVRFAPQVTVIPQVTV